MIHRDDRHTGAAELRRRAEGIAREETVQAPEQIDRQSPEETRQQLYELRVHQIELEMQNEELRRAQAELEALRARYFDLYDLAPVGYCTLSEKGLIIEANLAAATLLGVTRGALVGQMITRFIVKEAQDTYYLNRKQLFETGETQAYELRMIKADDTPFWAKLSAATAQDEHGASVCRMVLSDITAQKQAQEALQKTLDEIKTLRGIVPICMHCKNIRDDQGYWSTVETYVRDHSEAEFSHGICPECMKKLYPEFEERRGGAEK